MKFEFKTLNHYTLILDIKMSEAIKLAKDFGQNAILWFEEDAIPRLIITA